jgi:hypothetical protein
MFLQFLSTALLLTFSHDFHVSTTYGEFKAGQLQLTSKVFTNDLESALEEINGQKLDLGGSKQNKEARAFIASYLKNNFSLELNDKAQNLKFIGFEVDLDITYLYFEYNFKEVPKDFTVKNTLLFNSFSDQSNLVNIKLNQDLKSAFFDEQHPTNQFSY